jgi:hypothetical protein
MKRNALWMLLAFIPAMSASTITCNAGAASVPVFNLSSSSQKVGDYTLDCAGGTTVLPPNPVPQIDVDVVMNVPVLNTGGWILTDGVDNIAGILDGTMEIEFVGVPFNPPETGNLVLQVENIFVNPSAEPPGLEFTEDGEIMSNLSFGITNSMQLVAVNAVPEPSLTLVFIGFGVTMWLWRVRSSFRLVYSTNSDRPPAPVSAAGNFSSFHR